MSPESPTATGSRSPAAWLTWAAASGAALLFVLLLGSNVPYWDEWELVPAITGHQPITFDFLWSLHNEHRIPLGRLVYLGLFALTHDFRAGMVFDVLALSAAGALLIETARRVRGRGAWVDGVFALLLLNPGHAENLLWSFQIPIVLIPVLLAVALSAAARMGVQPTAADVIGVAVPMALSPLCGAPGVVLATVTGGWLIWLCFRSRRWLLPGALGLLCWALVGAYLYRYHGNPGHPKPEGGLRAIESMGEVLTVALGAGASWHWPWATGFVVLVVAGTCTAVTGWWWRSRRERTAAEALLAMAVATVALGLTVGWGRSGFGPGAGFAGRYAALSVPLLCWACLAWCRLPWRRAGVAVQAACWLAAVLLYPDNLAAGREQGEARRAAMQAFLGDLHSSLPLSVVVQRHGAGLYPSAPELHEGLLMLRPLRLGPFSREHEAAVQRRRFPFVEAPLIVVRDGLVPARADRVDGRPVIVLHADGNLVFDVRPGLREASGYFGMAPGIAAVTSGRGVPSYDGTLFEAIFRPDEGEKVELFTRLLNPLANPSDRGLVPFRVPLPPTGGRLVLATRAGAPGANLYGDWGCWGGIELR